jgi:hypothetical protein
MSPNVTRGEGGVKNRLKSVTYYLNGPQREIKKLSKLKNNVTGMKNFEISKLLSVAYVVVDLKIQM